MIASNCFYLKLKHLNEVLNFSIGMILCNMLSLATNVKTHWFLIISYKIYAYKTNLWVYASESVLALSPLIMDYNLIEFHRNVIVKKLTKIGYFWPFSAVSYKNSQSWKNLLVVLCCIPWICKCLPSFSSNQQSVTAIDCRIFTELT